MAVDMFLKLDGVSGEAHDSHGHQDEIEVLAWSWGIQQPGSTHQGRGGGAAKMSVQDLSITKYADKASSVLVKYAANGKHIASGQLTIRKAGGDAPVEYYKIALTDILVTSVSIGGSEGMDRLTENITLNFAGFEVAYTMQNQDGTAGEEGLVTVDIPGNSVS